MLRFDLLLAILLIPILWPYIAMFWFKKTVSIKEVLLNTGIVFVLGCLIWALSVNGAMMDTQIMNGKVTDKKKVWTSCSHSYSCHCRTVSSGSGKNQSTYTKCDTCYEHSNDWDWTVYTSVGNLDIDRIDRRGSDEPPRWTAVKMGEPAARKAFYTNYIKAAPNSIFHHMETLAGKYPIPNYPEVFDYYRVNRVIDVGSGIPQNYRDLINAKLNEELSTLGFDKQVNIVVIFTNLKNKEYATALQQAWLGGKKNDVVAVIGVDRYNIAWTEVFSWSKLQLFNVVLRDELFRIGTVTGVTVPQIATTIVADVSKLYARRPMSDFEYLKDDFDPPTWLVLTCFILAMLSSIGIFYWSHQEDVFGDQGYRY